MYKKQIFFLAPRWLGLLFVAKYRLAIAEKPDRSDVIREHTHCLPGMSQFLRDNRLI